MSKYFRTGILLLFACVIAEGLYAQSVPVIIDSSAAMQRKNIIIPRKPKLPSKELSVGVKLNTDGWSIFVDKGYVRTEETKNSDRFYNIRLFYVELSEKKHPKEFKDVNTDLIGNTNDKPKPFIYGKINNFYPFKLGFGYRRMIAGKPDPGTISIHWVYGGGLSIGLLKPYYIDAYVYQDNTGFYEKKSIRYTDTTKQEFLTKPFIVGSSGFSKGLGELKIVPGLHAKTGLSFDFAANAKTKLALEIGVAGDIYTNKIELMANQEAFPYFLNAYVSFQFGKRW